MRFQWNKELGLKSLYAFLTIAASIILLLLFLNLGGILNGICFFFAILSPFIYGIVIAYILNFPMVFFESKVFSFLNKNKSRAGLVRALSVAVSAIIFIAVMGTIVAVVIPQLISSIIGLISQLPTYFDSLIGLIKNTFDSFEMSDKLISMDELFKNLTETINASMPEILNTSVNITMGISNFFIGFIVSIYLLLSKTQLIAQSKKILFAIFPKDFTDYLLRVFAIINKVFSGFVTGKILEALIIGVLCFIGMVILNMPYTLLISILIGVTNLIPFFGPFIGAIPSILLILLVNPTQALWFLIFIIILQQIDAQIIGPKILGDSIGLSPLWVIFSIIVGAGLFGFAGLIIGVPIFAVLYAFIRELIEMRLERKGMPKDSNNY